MLFAYGVRSNARRLSGIHASGEGARRRRLRFGCAAVVEADSDTDVEMTGPVAADEGGEAAAEQGVAAAAADASEFAMSLSATRLRPRDVVLSADGDAASLVVALDAADDEALSFSSVPALPAAAGESAGFSPWNLARQRLACLLRLD